jgi:hypothetical protein
MVDAVTVQALVFDLHTLDWVGLGTLILAGATFALAVVTVLAVLDGKREISATLEQAEIARRSLEAGQRPVLVPIVDPVRRYSDIGAPHAFPLVPTVRSHRELLIPVINVGVGPALSVRVQVSMRDQNGDASPMPTVTGQGAAASIAAGESVTLRLSLDLNTSGTSGLILLLSYYDLGEKKWSTSVLYSASQTKVRSLRIDSPGPQGLAALESRIDADAQSGASY